MSDKGSTFSIREKDLYCQLLGRILLTIIFCIGLIIGSTLLAILAPQVGEPIYLILVLFFFLMIPIRFVRFCIGLIIGSTLLTLLAPQVGEPIYFILDLFFFLMIPIRIVGSIISCIEKTKGFIFDIENGTFSYYQEKHKMLVYPLSKRSVINLSEIESLATKNVVHRGTDDKGRVKKNYFYILYIYGNMPTVSLEFGDEEVRVEVERALVKYSAASSRVKRMETESFK